MVFGCRVRNLYPALLKPVEMRVGANRVKSDSHGMGIGISILSIQNSYQYGISTLLNCNYLKINEFNDYGQKLTLVQPAKQGTKRSFCLN
jgi:hypothetical protein